MALSSLFKPLGKLLVGGLNILDDLGLRDDVEAIVKAKTREVVGTLRVDPLFTEDVDAEWKSVVIERGRDDEAPLIYTERLSIPEGILYRIAVRDRAGNYLFQPEMIGVGPKAVIHTELGDDMGDDTAG